MGIVFTAIGGVLVAIFNSRNKAHQPGLTTLDPAEDWAIIRERVAVLEQRTDDRDEAADVQDRRLDQIERHLDLDSPVWKHDGHGSHKLRR